MKKKILFLAALMMFVFSACDFVDGKKTSTEFTSEEDVKDYCYGKSFKYPYLGVSTTGNSSNVTVKSYSGSTAIVVVYFDMSEVYGRAVQSGCTFEIDKKTGRYNKIDN